MSRPCPDDRIEMPCMGDDVNIRVRHVPEEQPHAADGVYTIVDQYGEAHQVELDGDTWTTVVAPL
jgi:hypothetical protein